MIRCIMLMMVNVRQMEVLLLPNMLKVMKMNVKLNVIKIRIVKHMNLTMVMNITLKGANA